MQPGWYPDPDDTNARRYWDGQAWSAPLPIEPPAAQQPAAEPELVDWQLRALEKGTLIGRQGAPSAPTCAAGPCQRPRVPGGEFCESHGPRGAVRGVAPVRGAAAIVCPHCGTQGRVTSRTVKQKKGVSGGKLTGAVLTGGLSMLGTGLSRKEKVTELRCGNCTTVWHV